MTQNNFPQHRITSKRLRTRCIFLTVWDSVISLHDSTESKHVRPKREFLPRDAMLSAVYAVVVCLCVCLSQFSIVSKWLNVG